MQNDIIEIKEMSKILNKTENVVRNMARKKQIPARKLGGIWYSSRMILSLYVAGIDVDTCMSEAVQNILNKSSELFLV